MSRASNARRSRILVTSFSASIGAVVVLAIAFFLCGTTAEAANNCTLTSTAPSTNWNDTTKWTSCGGAYPNNGDTANIGLSGFNMVINTPVNVVLNVTGAPVTFDVSNTLQLEASSSANSNSSMTINSGGKLTVAPGATITTIQSGIVINNGGTLEVQSGGQFSIGPGANFTFAGGTIQGPGTLNNPVGTPIAFTGSTGSLTMNNVIFNNSGTVNLVSTVNALAINSGTQFNNQSGATFNLNTSVPITTDGLSAPAINNSGTISIPASISPTVNPPLNNNGTISLNDTSNPQTLTLAGGGTHTGAFNAFSGPAGTVKFSGPHNFNSGWSWGNNSGTLFELVSGTATVNTSFVTPNYTQDAGTLTGPGNLSVSSAFDWKSGTQSGAGQTILIGAATLDGTATATLDGRTLQLNGASLTYNPGAGGSLAMINAAAITTTANINLKSDTTITSDGSAVINVSSGGSITKSTGTRTQLNPFVTISSGASLQPSATTIALGGGATISGTINTSTASSFLEIAGNTATLAAGSSVNSGDLLLTGGTLAANNALAISTMTQSGGTLKGTATLTINNTFNWTGGSMDGDTGGTGVLAIASPNGVANINGLGPTTLFHRFTFQNGGTVHYQPTNPLAVNSGGRITNNATWNLENNTAITSDLTTYLSTAPLFTNNSLLSKTTGGATSFGVPISNTATVSLNSGSDVELTGGGNFSTGTGVTFNNTADVLGIQTNNVSMATSVTGPGFLRVSNLGTLTTSGPIVTVPNFELDTNGTLSNASVFNITTKLIWTGGLMIGAGNVNLGVGAIGDLTVLSGSPALNASTFNNSGTITLGNAFPLQFQGNVTFNNNGGAIFDITGPGGTSSSGTGNVFSNGGTVKRSTASGVYSFDLPFTNSGTVDSAFANAFLDFPAGGSMTAGNMSGSVASAGVEFSAGTFSVSGGSFTGVGGVKINGGTLNVSTAVTGPNTMALLSGTLGTSGGTVSFNGGATFNQTGGTIQNVQLVSNGGAINFDSTSGLLTVDGATIGYNSPGTGQWIGGNQLFMKNGASMTIAGTVTFAGNGSIATLGTTPTITVNTGGILQKTTNAGSIGIAANLQNNGGTISSSNGALQLNYAGSSAHTGTFTATSPGTIDFGGGSHTFTSVTGTGSGFLDFNSGTISLVNTNTLTNLYLGTATINGAGSLAFSGIFNWDGGALNAVTTNSGGTLNLLGGSSQMNLGANLSSGANFSSATNAFAIGNLVTFTNNGTFTITADGPINGLGTFTNTGTLTKSAGTSSTISCIFNNNGIVNGNTGTLNFSNNGSDSGTYNSLGGTTLGFTGGSRTLSAASSFGAGAAGTTAISNNFTDSGTFTPAGPVSISAGTATLNSAGTATITGLTMTGGTLSGSAPLQLLGTANQWKGGMITGTGTFTLPSGSALTLAAGTGATLDGRTFTDAGTILATAPLQSLAIDNSGILNIQSTGIFDLQTSFSIANNFGSGSVSNAGLFKKSCCTSQTSSVAVPFTNTLNVDAQQGTIDFSSFTQSAGTTKLTGGALSSAATMNFSGGTLAGAGNINAPLTNSGATINPGDPVTPGALTINGTFNQTAAGTLVTDLFANNSNDQLLVPGNNASVAGNLNVQLVAPYSPANGDTFTVINAGALTDTTTKNYPLYGPNNTGTFTPNTTATTLSLAALIPQADVSVAGTTAPTSVVHTTTWTVTIPVVNNGPNGATGVTVNVTATNGTLTSLTTTQGSCLGNSCSVGSLTSSGSATVTASIAANIMPNVSATVTVSANETDPTPANNTATVSATVTPSADLALAITDSPDPVNAGATVNYTGTITNNGPDSSGSSTTFTVSGPSGASFGTLPGACSGTFPTVTCTSGTLTPLATASFLIPVVAPGSGPVSLTGNVTASGATDPNGANNASVQSTTVNSQADLSITKSGPASVAAGNNISYTIVVTNNGPSTATSVQVNDPTPAGLTFVSNGGACTSPFPCSIGNLANGATATITATYSTPPTGAPSSVTNSASVASSTTPDPNTANNSASASTSISPSADVAVSIISAPSSAVPGSNFNVVIKIQNNGPSDATGISIASTVPSSFSFSSNGGACTTAYPCSIGTLTPGQSVQITSTYQVVAGGSTATISYSATASSPDPNTANNSANATITTGCPSSAPTQFSPANGSTVPAYGFLHWNNVGADEYNVYLGPVGSGCTQFFAKRSTHFGANPDILVSLDPGTTYEWAVEAVTPGCPTLKSSCVTFTTQSNCNAAAPQPVSPNGGTVASPVTFTWSASNGATLYTVKNAADDSVIGTSTTTSLPNIIVPDGPFTWYVVADVPQCGQLRSQNATFNGCSIPQAPIVGVVASAASGQTYSVQWNILAGVQSYELQEAANEAFTDATTTATGNTSVPFTRSTTQGALAFFYRVRARSICSQTFGPYSTPVRVVILPPPPKTQKNPSVNVPAGSTQIVVQQVFVPGINDGIVHTFVATVDQPWLTVDPSSGILPAEGITLNVNANPATLPNGTETGTVIVTISGASGKTGSNGATTVSVPVSVNLVTPVIPSTKDLPPDNTLIIPSVGHLDGVNSHWQSDIRLANTGTQKLQYALKFTPADPSTGGVKTTTITVDGGDTTALDDIVKNWYGIGDLGESANGVLEVRPLTPSNKTGSDADTPSVSKVTVVSSRTYTTGENGTLGQFIPAIPFTSFIGKASQQAAASVLSLQQIAQSSQYRTNVGVVEGSGQPANVLLSIFDIGGKKLKDVPISLKAGEQAQFGSFLANVGIPSLSDGRIEVKVTSGDGRVTAYASVVDNQSTDPLLVTGVKLGAASADHYVLPGVANIDTGVANWRTDMRIFNGGTAAQNATLTFFRQGASPLTQSVVINAGEIRTLDDIVASLFGTSNSGGAVHVTTSGLSNLIVSGRTYNATANGTFGQFIPAVTAADSIASGDRPLQILQAEDSVRYRTNLGIAETTGKPAGVDVSVVLPDSKVTPVVHLDLAPNEFQQFDVFKSLGLDNTYNARITVRVTNGDGRVTAYGSVVDMLTNDPTYVPAQQ